MGTRTVTQVPLVDIHARVTRRLYAQLVEECGQIPCSLTALIRMALEREVKARKRSRVSEVESVILEGQMLMEELSNGQ